MKRILILIYFVFSTASIYAQKQWTLEDCLSYAQDNNITIKKAFLNTEITKQNHFQSKMALLPNLNASLSENTNFGRNIDPVTNQITIDRVRNNNFSLSSSVTLFNGFQSINNIRKNNFDYLSSKYDAEKIANDISVNIVTAYLQLLYNTDLVEVSQQKVDVSELQVERIAKMVEVGSLPKGDLLNTESQKSQEELQLINAQNQRDIAKLNLIQLLDLSVSESFDIVQLEVDVDENYSTVDNQSVYTLALENLPDVKSAETKLKSSERSLAISQGARSPRLSLSASVGTLYSDANRRLVYDSLGAIPTPQDYPFEDQFNDNVSQAISLSLSIPIFNNWQVNSSISRAKIGVLQAQYSLQEAKNNLRKTIEQAQNDARSAQKKYIASKKSLVYQEESFQYTQNKYDLQLVNSYDYNNAKNTLFKAETDLLQSKYDYLFKTKMLDFYMGKPLTF
ncbi:MAG: TolC family protein [Flavobacteriales bacterium]